MTSNNEWSGSCDPCDPANYWIDDETGERVNAATNDRTKHDCPLLNTDGSVKDDWDHEQPQPELNERWEG